MKSANHFRVIAPAILMLTLLTACGGNSGNSSTSTTTSATGTNTESTSTTDTINGVVVAKIPDVVVNEATLKGVDANANGVRDDVERFIAIDSAGDATLNARYITVAKKAQAALEQTTNPDFHLYKCSLADLTVQQRNVVRNAIFNTPERRAVYIKSLPAMGDDLKNVAPCISDVKPFKSNE